MANTPGPRSVLILRANPIDPDPRVEKTARGLAAAGMAVTVLGRASAGGENLNSGGPGWEIRRLRPALKPRKGLWNYPGLFFWQVNTFFWMLRNGRKYAVLHACDFETLLPAVWAGRFLGCKVIYDIFDFYADTLQHTAGWMTRLIRRIDLRMIAAVDAVILADESRREQIGGSRPRRVVIITNSPEELPPVGDIPQRPKASKLHIVYVGALEWRRGLRELIEVLRRHPEWSLRLAGRGRDEDGITALAEGCANIVVSGVLPYTQTLVLEVAADVIPAVFDPQVPNHRYASPNKLFEAMLLGKPLVCALHTGMDEIVTQADCGIVIPYGNTEELARALHALTDAALRERLGRNGQRCFAESYSWAVMSARLLALYREIGV